MRVSVLAMVIFVVSVTVCEIITFELPKVLDSNLWPWKWRSMTLTNCMKIIRQRSDEGILSTCKKMAPLGPAACSQYIIVYFAKYVRMYERTNERKNERTNFVRPAGRHRSYAEGTVSRHYPAKSIKTLSIVTLVNWPNYIYRSSLLMSYHSRLDFVLLTSQMLVVPRPTAGLTGYSRRQTCETRSSPVFLARLQLMMTDRRQITKRSFAAFSLEAVLRRKYTKYRDERRSAFLLADQNLKCLIHRRVRPTSRRVERGCSSRAKERSKTSRRRKDFNKEWTTFDAFSIHPIASKALGSCVL